MNLFNASIKLLKVPSVTKLLWDWKSNNHYSNFDHYSERVAVHKVTWHPIDMNTSFQYYINHVILDICSDQIRNRSNSELPRRSSDLVLFRIWAFTIHQISPRILSRNSGVESKISEPETELLTARWKLHRGGVIGSKCCDRLVLGNGLKSATVIIDYYENGLLFMTAFHTFRRYSAPAAPLYRRRHLHTF